ncbi:MAG: AbrB/MazE/SpoVT family DNA-binding domain-containing protein [Candidatus Njordarchaeia archaeon]
MSEDISRIDNKGRILIPSKIRRKLNLKSRDIVKIRIEGNKIVLEPIKGVFRVKARKLEEAFFDAGEATFGY